MCAIATKMPVMFRHHHLGQHQKRWQAQAEVERMRELLGSDEFFDWLSSKPACGDNQMSLAKSIAWREWDLRTRLTTQPKLEPRGIERNVVGWQ
jgi:hypothetical protein